MPSAVLFARLTDEDAFAIAAFLQEPPAGEQQGAELPALRTTVPISVSAVLPPEIYNALPASQK